MTAKSVANPSMFVFFQLVGIFILVFLPLVGALLGWREGRRGGAAARQLARLLSVAVFVGFLITAATGLFRDRVFDSSIHHWSGRYYLLLTVFAVPFAIGLTIQQHLRQRPLAAIFQVALFLFLLIVTFFASFTGYLGPDQAARAGQVLAEASRNRFIILHMFFAPMLISLLLVEWWWFFGGRTEHKASPAHR